MNSLAQVNTVDKPHVNGRQEAGKTAAEEAIHWRQLAEHYRGMGFNIVPLGGDKRPVITGLNKYTAKPDRLSWDSWQEIRQEGRLWTAFRGFPWWADVRGIGGICGPKIGDKACIDFDDTTSDLTAFFLSKLELPADYAWTVITPGNGMHVWVQCPGLDLPADSSNGLLKLPAADGSPEGIVELRWTGLYAVLPGSQHPDKPGILYRWAYDEPSGPPAVVAPEQLLAAYAAVTVKKAPEVSKPSTKAITPAATSSGGASESRYAARALEDEVQRVLLSAPHDHNNTVNRAAFSLGQLVGAGLLEETTVEQRLLAAAIGVGQSESEAIATIRSGLKKGKAQPRQVELKTYAGPAEQGAGEDSDEDGEYPFGFALECPEPLTDAELNPRFWWQEYKPDEAGQTDAFLHNHGAEWSFVTGEERWYAWNANRWELDEKRRFRRTIGDMCDEVYASASAASAPLYKAVAAAEDEYRKAAAKVAAFGKKPKPEDAKAAEYEAAAKVAERAKERLDTAKTEAKEGAATAENWRRTDRRINAIDNLSRDRLAVAFTSLSAGNLLNLANGTLDLDSYDLRPHSRADMLTYCLDYEFNPDAACPRWERFISEVLVREDTRTPDPELGALLQELIGYSLTNETRFEAMAWLWGNGANGKSTVTKILMRLLGSTLAAPFDFEALSRPDAGYHLAMLVALRAIVSTESPKNRLIADETLKKIVSGDPLKARPIRGEPITVEPVAKIWWAMNNKPNVGDTSDGFWRRLKLIPFYRQFSEQDKDPELLEKLEQELPGILNWALAGLRRLRERNRFTDAAAVKAAVTEYRTEEDPVKEWLNQNTTWGKEMPKRPIDPTMRASDAYADYQKFCAQNGYPAASMTGFGRELMKIPGMKREDKTGGRRYTFGLLELLKKETAETASEPTPAAAETKLEQTTSEPDTMAALLAECGI